MFRVVHFEIAADDPERAVKFYSEVFGWKIHKWEGPIPYWLVHTGDSNAQGIDGAIMHRDSPSLSTVNTIQVPDIDEYIEKIELNGGKVVSKKIEIPDVGFFAYCSDSESNVFGVIQEFETISRKSVS